MQRQVVGSRGLGLVTGEVGSGKSISVRALASILDGDRNPVLYVSQGSWSVQERIVGVI